MNVTWMRVPVLLLGATLGVSCGRLSAFDCTDGSQCVISAIQGYCEPSGFCSFPDQDCDSDRRFGRYADVRAGECVSADAEDSSAGQSNFESSGRSGSTGVLTTATTTDSVADSTDGSRGMESTVANGTTADPGFESTGGTEGFDSSTTTGTETESTGDIGPELTCNETYGALAAFELCDATETSCTFFVQSGGQTCDDMCGQRRGGTCEGSVNDEGGTCGPPSSSQECNVERDSQICRCASRTSGPLNDAACEIAYGQVSGFELCGATDTACTFFVQSAGASCNDICEPTGPCEMGFNDVGGTCPDDTSPPDCAESRATQICRCSL